MRHLKGLRPNIRPAGLALGLAIAIAAWALSAQALAQDAEPGYEPPPVLSVAEVVPQDLQQSTFHTVEGNVPTEGHFYHFDVKSHYGRYQITSMEMLKIRAHEIRILKRAVELKDQYQFLQSAGGRIEAMGEALVGTVVHPVETAKAVTKGVGKKIEGVARIFKGRKRSERRDSFFKELLLAKHKRRIAYELEVDVYSSNPQLQDLLDSIATERAAGQATIDLGSIFIPGGIGVVVSVGKFEANMKGLLRDMSAGELVGMNNDKLEYMGVPPDLRKQFLDQVEFSPHHQTYLVGALEQMRGVKQRSAFLKAALHARDEPSALYYQMAAEMLAQYHLKETPLEQLAHADGIPIAFTTKGSMVVVAPYDYGYWDEETLRGLKAIQQSDPNFAERPRELILVGRLSPKAKQSFQRWGFQAREDYQVSL